jgi:subtilase family serine protease
VASAAIAAAGAPQPGTPAYLQQAYDLSFLSETAGTTETVAIVDAFDDPNAESDLDTYRAEFGLPACTSANGCFTKVDQNGGTNYPASDTGWDLEISLDLDAVSALCPNCHIDLVEAASAGTSDLAAAELEAYDLRANVISDSWDLPLSGHQAHQFPQTGNYTFKNVTTVAASGDAGYPGTSTNDFPAALPDVTAAGGTTLEPASASGVASAREFTESAWSDAGSGCNLGASKPAWQTDTGCAGRSYADISADADPDTGMQVYDSDDGGWVVVGGTSEATPLIAAYYALLGSAAQGPSWAYTNASLLNDPTTGSNGACAASMSYICDAGPGYDGPTGVGSISGAVTTGAPGISGPGTNGTYGSSTTATTTQLAGGVYPNGADTSYWWEYGPTTDYGQLTPATDIGSSTAPVAVSDSLVGLSPATTYHYRLVAQNQYGTEYGYDFTLTTPASSASSPTQGSTTSPTTSTQPPPSTTTTTSNPPVTEGGSGSSGPPIEPAGAPLVTNLKIAPAASTATISATIAGHGAATTYALQYGTTASLGRTAPGSLATSRSTANVSLTLRNLSPGKVYYVRAVATNTGGSTYSKVIRFRTSPLTITSITTRGGDLLVVLRCHGSAPCRFRLQGRSGTRVMLSSQGSIRGNRSGTVTLALTRAFETLATHSRTATLSVLSTWNGVAATVSATI